MYTKGRPKSKNIVEIKTRRAKVIQEKASISKNLKAILETPSGGFLGAGTSVSRKQAAANRALKAGMPNSRSLKMDRVKKKGR